MKGRTCSISFGAIPQSRVTRIKLTLGESLPSQLVFCQPRALNAASHILPDSSIAHFALMPIRAPNSRSEGKMFTETLLLFPLPSLGRPVALNTPAVKVTVYEPPQRFSLRVKLPEHHAVYASCDYNTQPREPVLHLDQSVSVWWQALLMRCFRHPIDSEFDRESPHSAPSISIHYAR
jgi:hypothetical protein